MASRKLFKDERVFLAIKPFPGRITTISPITSDLTAPRRDKGRHKHPHLFPRCRRSINSIRSLLDRNRLMQLIQTVDLNLLLAEAGSHPGHRSKDIPLSRPMHNPRTNKAIHPNKEDPTLGMGVLPPAAVRNRGQSTVDQTHSNCLILHAIVESPPTRQ